MHSAGEEGEEEEEEDEEEGGDRGAGSVSEEEATKGDNGGEKVGRWSFKNESYLRSTVTATMRRREERRRI
jgi:hypothetical protein